MTDYVKSTNFASKDSLAIGNPLKIVKGTEIDTEFNNIATAVATKADLNSPAFIGAPVAPTASTGTNTGQLATTAFVKNTVDAYDAALTVSTAQIENDAVTADKIATGAVGNTELATDAVTQVKMANNSVGTAEIIDANVTSAKLETLVKPVGVGQTWQDLTSSRAAGTTYTNSTGRPITVAVTPYHANAGQAQLSVSGVVVGRQRASIGGGPNVNLETQLMAIVPSGSSYTVTVGSGALEFGQGSQQAIACDPVVYVSLGEEWHSQPTTNDPSAGFFRVKAIDRKSVV
jgi:hypothetical protein